MAITLDEYRWIQSYTTSKKACDILETTLQGTSTIKRSKILKLSSDFELCIMEEDETFENFYAPFLNIVKFYYNLGRPISEEKQIERIFYILPYRFHAKGVSLWLVSLQTSSPFTYIEPNCC